MDLILQREANETIEILHSVLDVSPDNAVRVFFSEKKVAAAAAKVRKQLGLGDAPIILYAPTFRRDTVGAEHTVDIDFERVRREYEAAHGVRPYILYRCHYYENGKKAPEGMVNVSAYPDMQELLCAADALITDYSSCIWDYSLLACSQKARPCYLFVPDLEEYVSKEQGLFTPIESWYGAVCKSNDELCGQMAMSQEKKEELFKAMAERQLATFGSYERGKACERLHSLVQELRRK